MFLIFLGLAAAIARQLHVFAQTPPTAARRLTFALGILAGPVVAAVVEVLVLWRASLGAMGTALEPFPLPLVPLLWLENVALVLGILFAETVHVAAQTRRPRAPRAVVARVLAARPMEGIAVWVLVVVVLGVAVSWAELVYPRIPSFLGGGRPEPARLITTQSVADACRPCVDSDVLLLDADDKRIVVLATGSDGRQFAVEVFLISGNDRAVIHRPR